MGYRLRRIASPATFVRLAISIILAMIIWGFIVWETNPEITREFQNIAVTTDEVPANMLIVGGLPSVTVTIKGPQDDVRTMVPSDFTAKIDLSEVNSPGINEYEVEVDAPSSVRRVIVEPSTIEVELDLIVTRTYPISLQEDEPRPASITSIEPSTKIASIQGPKALVDRVDSVVLPVDLQGRQESFTEDVELVPVDANGQRVTDVEVSPASVELSVTFEVTSKDVPVIVICACIVDDRLEQIALPNAAAIPSTVRLSGPSAELTTISEIRTDPVDTSQLDESGWILDVAINTSSLPDSVTLSDQTVDVWVPVAPSQLEISDVQIKIAGLGQGLEASLSEEIASVVVTGSDELLADPDSLDVMPVVDLSDLTVGTYTVEVDVVVSRGLSYEEITPATVQVTIKAVTTTANRLREVNIEPTQGIR